MVWLRLKNKKPRGQRDECQYRAEHGRLLFQTPQSYTPVQFKIDSAFKLTVRNLRSPLKCGGGQEGEEGTLNWAKEVFVPRDRSLRLESSPAHSRAVSQHIDEVTMHDAFGISVHPEHATLSDVWNPQMCHLEGGHE